MERVQEQEVSKGLNSKTIAVIRNKLQKASAIKQNEGKMGRL